MIKNTMILLIQLIVGLCFLTFSPSWSQATVTLSIGDGSGLPGSSENPVKVSLGNPNDEVKGVQMDICDEDDYLSCNGCETTGRASDFMCTTNELQNGCCRVILYSVEPDDLIESGTGPILTLKYDASGGAPAGECRDLNPDNVKVADKYNDPLHVTSVAGEFCFEPTPTVTLSIGDGSGLPGSSENPVKVSLDNPNDEVKGVQMDICDEDDYLSCSGCETTGRASDFMCTTNELPNSCCRVLLYPVEPDDLIESGTGPILTLKYDASGGAPAGECRDLNPDNVKVADKYNESLHVTSVPGEFCFLSDIDSDGIPDEVDNCPLTPNGPDGGTCSAGNVGNTCKNNGDCGTGGFCSMDQEDADGDGIGDVCDRDNPVVSVFLDPDDTVILRGDILGFQTTVINNTDEAETVYFATDVQLPNGDLYPPSGYLFGPIAVILNPHQSLSGHLTQYIPTIASLGDYIYYGYAYLPGVGFVDQDQFEFGVTAAMKAEGGKDWETDVDKDLK